jgi:glycosyltransferase involved in cell wall biosynthesis
MRKSFAIYLPAYNAALTLPKVLDRIPQDLKSEAKLILVLDNHSADNTEKIVLDYKTKHSLPTLQVLRAPRNLGYGGSQKLAYRYCIERGIDIVCMVHADGQYAPEVLGDLLDPVMNDQADMVFGSRIKGSPLKGGMPVHRFLGNKVLTFIQNFILRSRLSEFHSGYRIFNLSTLKRLSFEHLSDDYHFDTEMIILHIREKLRIKEITIPTHYGDEENYVNIWKYALQVMVTTVTYFLHDKGLRRSKNWGRIINGIKRIDREQFLTEIEQDSRMNGLKPVSIINSKNEV